MTDEEFRELVYEAGCDIGTEEVEAFKRYYKLLTEKNKVMNLTAITEYDDVLIKHFADSLLVHKAITGSKEITDYNLENFKRAVLLDVGTGAGFPGLPLKICNPGMTVHLLDSLNKRVRFLETVVSELGLDKVECIHGRAEDVSREKK